MPARLWALTAFLVLNSASLVYADEQPTIEDVNANPKNYIGKTLTFEKVDLIGTVTTGQVRYRFTIRTPAGNIYKDSLSAEQNIVFVSRNKDANIKKFVESLKADHYYTVTLTVEIRKGKNDSGQAIIKKIESAPFYEDKN